MDSLLKMREHAVQLQQLVNNGAFDVQKFGRILDQSWQLKRHLSSKITTGEIDRWYCQAMKAGGLGGKLCGAGGGGFLLFIVEPERQAAVRAALSPLTEVPVAHEVHGSQLCSPFVQ
jgi:D-glycero-alpha-D-manno-heptose-7-phosphate kinase